MRVKLKERREYCGLNQADVAKAAGISRAYYSRIENGAREGSVVVWGKIADKLNYPRESVAELIYNDDKRR